ncbi:Uncharacterised protein [Bordetella pertussis]|nr:Uncharacterised protein [Bordetella pertussis]
MGQGPNSRSSATTKASARPAANDSSVSGTVNINPACSRGQNESSMSCSQAGTMGAPVRCGRGGAAPPGGAGGGLYWAADRSAPKYCSEIFR